MCNLNKFIFTNNQYNVLYRNSYDRTNSMFENTNCIILNDGSTGQESYSNASQRTKAVVKNIEINRIYTATGARIEAQNLRVDATDLMANNIRVNHKVMHNDMLTGWNSNMTNGSFIELEGSNSLNVSEIYADFTGSNINSARVFKNFILLIILLVILKFLQKIFILNGSDRNIEYGWFSCRFSKIIFSLQRFY